MPQELPGFYYDAEKNRYFPIKGRIPGSNPSSSVSAQKQNPNQENNICRRSGIRMAQLLHVRELYGNIILSNKGKCNFQEEYQKERASQPVVWKYEEANVSDGALEHMHIDTQSPEGQMETNLLVTGSVNGTLSLYEVGKDGQHLDYGVKCMPDYAWPLNMENQAKSSKMPGYIWRPLSASVVMQSNVCSIKRLGKHSLRTIRHTLITTLGSEISGGSVYVLNLTEPLNFNSSGFDVKQILHKVASFSSTIWTADCNSDGSRAVIGTNLGVRLINLETGVSSWVCRSKSDVLSQQFDQSGNVILCGLRNGAVVTVDVRQKPEGFSSGLARHRIPCPSHKVSEHSIGSGQNFAKYWVELKGNLDASRTIFMPSAISCLVSLQSYDQYFLASSMDGSIKLYDHRIIHRGAVQSYQGHVNSHTRIQLGVDPSERFVLSGGEDCNVRLWSIKSGEMLFDEKISNSVPSTVCWPRSESRNFGVQDWRQSYEAWFGSNEGIFHFNWK